MREDRKRRNKNFFLAAILTAILILVLPASACAGIRTSRNAGMDAGTSAAINTDRDIGMGTYTSADTSTESAQSEHVTENLLLENEDSAFKEDEASEQKMVGDIILADGSVIKAEDFLSICAENLPIAVVAEIKEDGRVLGVGVHRSDTPLQWALDGTVGNTTRFSEMICVQKTVDAMHAENFLGDTDGSDNWELICAMDEQGAKNGEYPAFDFVNAYAERYHLSGDDAVGWYLPSIAELYTVYENYEAVSESLQKIHELDKRAAMDGLGTNWYWSSSQSESNSEYAWFVHYFNGYASDCPKIFTNLHVLAVRIFSE